MTRSTLFALLCLASLTLVSRAAVAADPVEVELRDGRRWSGQIDSRTDPRRLVIQRKAGSVIIRRSMPWSQVVSVTRDGHVLTPGAVQKMALTPPSPQAVAPAASKPLRDADRARQLLGFEASSITWRAP